MRWNYPEMKGTADPGKELSLGSRFRPPAGALGSGCLDAGLFQVCGGAGIASTSRAAAGPFARLGQTALETACYAFLSHRFQCGPSFTIHLFVHNRFVFFNCEAIRAADARVGGALADSRQECRDLFAVLRVAAAESALQEAVFRANPDFRSPNTDCQCRDGCPGCGDQ